MEINTWIDFVIYFVFTSSVVFIGLPLGAKLSYQAIKRLLIDGNRPYLRNSVLSQFGKTPLQTLLVGLFGLAASIWYLFYDRGGALLTFYSNCAAFLSL